VLAAASFGWRGLLIGAVSVAVARFPRRRRRPGVRHEEVDHLATLVLIGLAAGSSVPVALRSAGAELSEAVAAEVEDLVRRSKLNGLAQALAETTGPLAELATTLARASVTGAPSGLAIEAFLATRRGEARARLLERARTLPVRLVIPLALLLLPGFLAMVLGPTIADQLSATTGLVRP
jgi:hypothetical protein